MNNELVIKLLANKVELKNFDSTSEKLLKSVEWKSQDSKSNSILFYKIAKGSEDKFLSSIENAEYGILVINSFEKSFSSLKNVLIAKENEWLECQKIILDHLYPFPFSQIKLVGITGTNGKTTTTDLVRQIAMNDGKNVLTIGTLGVKKNNDQVIPEGLTTPPYIELRKILFNYARDVDVVVMEVSSHSLVQERVYKLKYDAAAWTSFSQDHLDFHKDLNEYFHAKTLLIEKHLKIGSPCFIPAYEEELYAKLKNYSATHKTKTLIERKVEKLPLFFMSHFNKSNLEVAWDICEYLWKRKVSPDLFKFKMTEGRFSIFAFQDKKIIIDFAHTPDALENICQATKLAFPDSKIHLVFGCGGNRDKSKRPQMGKIAEDMSDFVYVTSDNPRHEVPEEIIKDILAGMSKKNHQTIIKREEAIRLAFKNMQEHDVLIIAGKGHENYQIIGDVKYPYTDQAVIEKLVKGENA
jgi:UDP-N-acetylmuramoyl-L-alanyl-D-glutamate--2,6-diaminopimelate ligase